MFNEYCPPTRITLPSIYADALSYYEVVCMLRQKAEDLQKQFDEQKEAYKLYTDNAIATAMESINRQLQNTVDELNNQYAEFQSVVNSNLNLFRNDLTNLDRKIDLKEIAINERTDLAIQQNNEYIFNEIDTGLLDLKVVNGFTGETVTIQSMIDYLSALHMNNALTVNELIARNKTVNVLKNYNISITDLLMNGKNIIV